MTSPRTDQYTTEPTVMRPVDTDTRTYRAAGCRFQGTKRDAEVRVDIIGGRTATAASCWHVVIDTERRSGRDLGQSG